MSHGDPTPPLGDDRPLEGLQVVELASVLAGPLVGTFLAELGAKVTKVEPPGQGDVTRNWRLANEPLDGPSAYYTAANGPKNTVRINLKSNGDSRKENDQPESCRKPCNHHLHRFSFPRKTIWFIHSTFKQLDINLALPFDSFGFLEGGWELEL